MPTSRSYARTSSPVDTAPLERESPIRIVSEPRSPTLPAPVYEPAIPDPGRPPAPVERRLPEHRGKVARISDELAGLSEDLRAWVELRIELVRTEVTEQVDYKVNQAKQGAAAGVLAVLGIFFLLVTLALGLGWWLGQPFWGFLIVTLLLLLGAGLAYFALQPKNPGR
ncbi:MAG: phage holin family protein [Rhodothermaceae bacterium]|nr:phage holin family protein [Rhodothermaceae bacterium]